MCFFSKACINAEDDTAEVRLAAHHFAGSVSLQPLVAGPLTDRERDSAYILSLLEGQPLTAGDRVRLNLFGTRICDFMVAETTPGGAVVVSKSTYLNLLKPANVARPRRISYEDIGGLGSQIRSNQVVIHEDSSLATILTQLELGSPIPEELYQTVVDIYVYLLNYSSKSGDRE